MLWQGLSSLFLLASSSSAFLNAADYLVTDLDKIVPAYGKFDGKMYAGMLPIDVDVAPEDKRGELMFWLFQPRKPVASDTFTIWFNGGPVRKKENTVD
jgi:hypothetical protein